MERTVFIVQQAQYQKHRDRNRVEEGCRWKKRSKESRGIRVKYVLIEMKKKRPKKVTDDTT